MIWAWVSFLLLVLSMLALDLGVFHRSAHKVTMKEALTWSAIWIFCGLSFSFFIYFAYEYHWFDLGLTVDSIDGQMNTGFDATIKYLTGYIIEKSLSVDNIFVIAMLFGFLAVPAMYQHRVLFWGILGALLMRGIMIGVGANLVARYHWILYIFGVFLIITSVKMLIIKEHNDPAQNAVVKWLKKYLPFTDKFHGEHFIVRAGSEHSRLPSTPDAKGEVDNAVNKAKPGKIMLTPLALALFLVETTDVIFAVDSIPAIFAITTDPFLVFTSNVFAILGLRSLYFALAGLIDKFHLLKVSLAIILAMVGLKMIFVKQLKDALGPGFNLYLLAAVVIILIFGVLASLWTGPRIDPKDLEK